MRDREISIVSFHLQKAFVLAMMVRVRMTELSLSNAWRMLSSSFYLLKVSYLL